MSKNYGLQIGVIVYGKGLNARAYLDEYKAAGYAVVLCDGYATIHKKV